MLQYNQPIVSQTVVGNMNRLLPSSGRATTAQQGGQRANNHTTQATDGQAVIGNMNHLPPSFSGTTTILHGWGGATTIQQGVGVANNHATLGTDGQAVIGNVNSLQVLGGATTIQQQDSYTAGGGIGVHNGPNNEAMHTANGQLQDTNHGGHLHTQNVFNPGVEVTLHNSHINSYGYVAGPVTNNQNFSNTLVWSNQIQQQFQVDSMIENEQDTHNIGLPLSGGSGSMKEASESETKERKEEANEGCRPKKTNTVGKQTTRTAKTKKKKPKKTASAKKKQTKTKTANTEMYQVENILDSRYTKQDGWTFKVKWVGDWGKDSVTWEPEKCIGVKYLAQLRKERVSPVALATMPI